MFLGHTYCNLDNKSRLVLPSKFRKYINSEINNKLILTRGVPECILVYPQDAWDKVLAKLMNYNYFDPDERNFIKELLFFASECEIDSQNRILLPANLIEFAHIKKEVIVNGMIDKLEIWNPEEMKTEDAKQKSTYAEIAKTVSESIYNKNFK
jgi:MraZ protein